MSFIDEHRSRFGVEPISRTLEWNLSSYYARKTRPPSRRELEDARLLGEIRRVHEDNYEAYGARRVWKQLAREAIEVGRCRVERLMHAHGIRGAQPSKPRRSLTVADESAARPADLVDRDFRAAAPNLLWVCDLTYLKTLEGFLYLGFVKDVLSRLIVGWDRRLAAHRARARRARDGGPPTPTRQEGGARAPFRSRQPARTQLVVATPGVLVVGR